jgi:hypothetical protein
MTVQCSPVQCSAVQHKNLNVDGFRIAYPCADCSHTLLHYLCVRTHTASRTTWIGPIISSSKCSSRLSTRSYSAVVDSDEHAATTFECTVTNLEDSTRASRTIPNCFRVCVPADDDEDCSAVWTESWFALADDDSSPGACAFRVCCCGTTSSSSSSLSSSPGGGSEDGSIPLWIEATKDVTFSSAVFAHAEGPLNRVFDPSIGDPFPVIQSVIIQDDDNSKRTRRVYAAGHEDAGRITLKMGEVVAPVRLQADNPRRM